MTEEEQREWTESARAAIAELEQLNAEPELTRQAAEPEAEAEGISSPQTPEPTELQEGCCTVQETEEAPEVEVVPAEAIVPLGQIGGDAPVEEERWAYALELIGDAWCIYVSASGSKWCRSAKRTAKRKNLYSDSVAKCSGRMSAR